MKNLRMLIILVLGLLFNGCAPTYSIEPQIGKNDTLSIDSLVFQRDLFENANFIANSDNITERYINFTFDGKNECNEIYFISHTIKNEGYLLLDLDSMLRKVYKNCHVIEISNLKFYSLCKEKNTQSLRQLLKKDYLIGMSTPKSSGYSSVSQLGMNKKCYNTLLNHFKDKALQDKVEIKEYNFIN